jgi:hypothetical protein
MSVKRGELPAERDDRSHRAISFFGGEHDLRRDAEGHVGSMSMAGRSWPDPASGRRTNTNAR